MNENNKTTEEILEELESVAIVEIKMTSRGIEFFNSDHQSVFTIPFAGSEAD